MTIAGATSSGIQGMNVFSSAIGSISDNLANSSTVGYKRVDTQFQDMINGQELSYQSPVSVQSRPIYRNDVSGAVTTTGTPTNFSITNGQGFATVSKLNTSASGETVDSTQAYTQAGDFSMDGSGYMANSAGYVLMGVRENGYYSGNFPSTASSTSLVPVEANLQIYGTMPAAASTTIDCNANFPADAPVVADPASGGPAAGSSGDSNTSVQVYDSAGNAQNLSLTFRKTAADTWEVVGGTVQGTPPVSVVPSGGPYQTVAFDSTGRLTGATNLTFNASGLSGGGSLNNLTLNLGTATTGSTQWSGTSIEVRNSTDETGHASGTFESASVDSNGYVNYQYSNGLVAKPYRVPLATFANPDGLSQITGAVFGSNPTAAGTATQQWAGENNAGTLDSGTVEQSNVDIATELTKMITAQNYYSSNSKVVSSSDQMTEAAINLKT